MSKLDAINLCKMLLDYKIYAMPHYEAGYNDYVIYIIHNDLDLHGLLQDIGLYFLDMFCDRFDNNNSMSVWYAK